MFYVKEKSNTDNNENATLKAVYGVQYKHGYPFFTFYEDGVWITKSAKYYVPVLEDGNTFVI